jgi:hypothetical protein
MPYITLCVTPNVLAQVNGGNAFQRQMAIRGASAQLAALIATANAANRVLIDVNDQFTLAVGDTTAIWGAHQAPGQQSDDFRDLFSLLSRRAGTEITFTW